ncbi:hypothetical protein WH47_03019, partial [Habropoda laboriosa]
GLVTESPLTSGRYEVLDKQLARDGELRKMVWEMNDDEYELAELEALRKLGKLSSVWYHEVQLISGDSCCADFDEVSWARRERHFGTVHGLACASWRVTNTEYPSVRPSDIFAIRRESVLSFGNRRTPKSTTS